MANKDVLTPEQIEENNRKMVIEKRKERREKVLNAVFVLSFFTLFIGGIIAIYNSETLQYVIIGGSCIIAVAFIFLSAYVLFEKSNSKIWKNLIRALVIGIIIIAIILLLGYLLPEGYVNDAHRPDKF